LDKETKRKYSKATCGNAYVVKLPTESTLHQNEKVEYVIHILGPNMNPSRPNCLNDNYEVGDALLKKCYESMLEKFHSLLSGNISYEDIEEKTDKKYEKKEEKFEKKFKNAKSEENFDEDAFNEDLDKYLDEVTKKQNKPVNAFSVIMNKKPDSPKKKR